MKRDQAVLLQSPFGFWPMYWKVLSWLNSTLVAIQGLFTLLNEQEKCLEILMNTLKEDCIVNGSDQFTDVLDHVLCGSYQVSSEDAETIIKDQDPFILCLLEDILKQQCLSTQKWYIALPCCMLTVLMDSQELLQVEMHRMDQPTSYHQ